MTEDERKARRAAVLKRYRAANAEKIKALRAKRKADGRKRGDQRRYYEKHADKICERQRDAYAANPERHLERRRQSRTRNIEREKAYDSWYRRRGKRGSGAERDPNV